MIPSDPVGGPKNTANVTNPVTSTPFVPTATPDIEKGKDGSPTKKNDAIGQKEFLTLLINQLQNQDPLNPMDNQEFATQLAQFSQLEQLISMNQSLAQLAGTGTATISSMASFLGHEVVLDDGPVAVKNGQGPNILLNVPAGTQSLRVDFLDASGAAVGSKVIEAPEAGYQGMSLNDLNVSSGTYDLRVVSVNSVGQFAELPVKITGTVEGFVVEPEPALLVNGEQVPLTSVKEVHQGIVGRSEEARS